MLYTMLFIIIPGCFMYTYVDYSTYGLSRYVVIDIINLVAIILVYVAYLFYLLPKKVMMMIAVYCIVFNLWITLLVSISDPHFNFEPFFTTAEMLVVLLIFTIGLFVHFQSILVLLTFNTLFVIVSFFTSGKDYPIERFVYYGVVVGGAGIMAYISQRAVIRLYKKVKAANILVNVQNEELKAINHSKDELFKIIGHDLKTPFYQLTNLVNLLDDAETKQEREQLKASIKEAAEKGTFLLDDLLSWGKNPELHTNIVLKEQESEKIIKKVLAFFKTNADQKEIEIINTISNDFKVIANPLMLETILRNIITNAIKFSYRKSTIVIKSNITDNVKSIIIEDQGIGIKPKQLKKLFDTPILVTKPGTENEKGSGFGLNIAKKLMEKQKGTLIIKSKFGKGTSVVLNFPTS